MIKNVWVYLVQILKALFSTPEYTKLEQELIKRCEHLEYALAAERERYRELATGLLPASRVVSQNIESKQPIPGPPSWDIRKKQLEKLSLDRVKKMEEHAKQMEAEISARSGNDSPELSILRSDSSESE